MYIFKNSFRNTVRNKGRTILTGIIILVIAFSSCVALSIRQAAQTAKEEALEGLSITAQISLDRSSMMKQQPTTSDSSDSSDNKTDFAKMMKESELSVEDMQKYAGAESVSDFYYTLTTSVNAVETEAVQSSSSVANRQSDTSSDTDTSTDSKSSSDTSSNSSDNSAQMPTPPDMNGDMGMPQMGTQGDFTIIGYSADNAMTAFTDGTSKITSGQVFSQNSTDPECIISEELAEYNSLSVGDTIKICNPNDESETYTLKIVGIYSNSQSGVQEGGNMGFSTSSDPANQILMSYTALKAITDKSESVATTTTNDFGLEQSSAINANVSGTYVFDDVESYEKFESQARALGLSDDYTVSSKDLSAYEQSLTPLETLSKIAGYFLIVILVIGAIILVVLNIFSVRERKYEIGVLMAMGMKKKKVAMQFISEIMIVTLMAAIIGGAAGAAASVPVTNALLQNQITASEEASNNMEQNFGRPMDAPDMNASQNSDSSQSDSSKSDTATSSDSDTKASDSDSGQVQAPMMQRGANYISEVNEAVNLKVVAELLGICVLLGAAGSAVAVTAIMRYEPLQILSSRD